jgi:hypothetical protein
MFLNSSNYSSRSDHPGSRNGKSSKPVVSAAGVRPAAKIGPAKVEAATIGIGPTEPAEVKSATTGVITSAGVAAREVHVAATGV